MSKANYGGILFPGSKPSGKWWRDHSLSIVLIGLMFLQTAHAIWTGSYVFAQEQPFGDAVQVWSSGFWMWWSYEYNVSLVADTFGVLLIVVLSKWLREKGSNENGSDE